MEKEERGWWNVDVYIDPLNGYVAEGTYIGHSRELGFAVSIRIADELSR